jgi:hypothetical protein
MNWNRRESPKLVLAIALCIAGAYSVPSSSEAEEVVAQSVLSAKSSKVVDVLWTRRTDHYTLQVVFPTRDAEPSGGKDPVVSLWLLGADGVAIPTSRDRQAKNISTSGPFTFPISEISYSVPLSSGQSAIAVALKIDDDYFIQKLKPLN